MLPAKDRQSFYREAKSYKKHSKYDIVDIFDTIDIYVKQKICCVWTDLDDFDSYDEEENMHCAEEITSEMFEVLFEGCKSLGYKIYYNEYMPDD